LPDHASVQIDKRQDEWLLTYWINPGVTLRLRIRHTSYSISPDELICEVSASCSGHEFKEVARLFWHPDDDPSIPNWPVQWRRSFARLANLWFVLVTVADWGLALGHTPAGDDAAHLSAPMDDSVTSPTPLSRAGDARQEVPHV
jgi:hypothetical protein